MKKLHLICSNDDLREHLCHIKFTYDKVYVTNGHVAAILPTNQVLPGILQEGEELFVHATEWKNSKAYNATTFKRMGNDVVCKDAKGNKTVFEFSTKNFSYPDVESAFPTSSEAELNMISFDAELYATLLEAIGCKKGILKFTAQNKAIRILPYQTDGMGRMTIPMEGVEAILMPLMLPKVEA